MAVIWKVGNVSNCDLPVSIVTRCKNIQISNMSILMLVIYIYQWWYYTKQEKVSYGDMSLSIVVKCPPNNLHLCGIVIKYFVCQTNLMSVCLYIKRYIVCDIYFWGNRIFY